MDILIKVAQAFLAFTLLVGIHEFGHYITARWFKMRVDKFYIMFDPWFSLFKFKRGDTEYGLGWLPLGGYCKISGMVDESMDTEQLAQPAKPWEFRSKPAWQRLIVMLGGVTFNLIFAILIYIGISFAWGEEYMPIEKAKWGFEFNERVEALGFRDGDKIISIDGEKVKEVNEVEQKMILSNDARTVLIERDGKQMEIIIPLENLIDIRKHRRSERFATLPMPFVIDSAMAVTAKALQRNDQIIAIDGVRYNSFNGFTTALASKKNEQVELSVVRNADTLSLSLPVSSEGKIGVIPQNPYTLEVRKFSLLGSVPAGFRRAGSSLSSYWEQIKLIAQPKNEMYRELGGFIAIGNMFTTEWNWHDFWLRCAFLSIILAVMNILPIPGLDGAHAVFAVFEIVTGKKPSDKFLESAQYVGLFLLLGLMLYANGNDIYRLIFG